jgi:hypothetical protein
MLRVILLRIVPLKIYPYLLLITLFTPFQAQSENAKLPSPLNLKTAISFAKNHPRTHLSPEQQLITPQRHALFLNCHNLIFSSTTNIDNTRNGVTTHLIAPVELQKLSIMQAFYDVLLSDSSIIAINEDMAGAFVSFDRAKARQEYKQVSEVEVVKLEAEYQNIRQQFFSGEAIQRIARSHLAQTINHPNELSSELSPPNLIKSPKVLPEVEYIYAEALKNNGWMNKLKEKSNDDQIALIDRELKQQILELILRLRVLAAAKERSEAESYRRDLNLELSRALYEMEVKASLGRSMTLQSKARMNDETLNYCQNLTWAKLNALQGLDVLTPPPLKADAN